MIRSVTYTRSSSQLSSMFRLTLMLLGRQAEKGVWIRTQRLQGEVQISAPPAHCTWPSWPTQGAQLLPDPEPSLCSHQGQPEESWAGVGRDLGPRQNQRVMTPILGSHQSCWHCLHPRSQKSEPGPELARNPGSSSASSHTVATWSGKSLSKDPGRAPEEEGKPGLGALQHPGAEPSAALPLLLRGGVGGVASRGKGQLR